MNWAWLWIIVMLVSVAGVYVFGRRNSGKLLPEALITVEWNEHQIIANYPNGEKMSVRWDCLTRVAIRTTSDGPFNPDVFWGLHAGGEQAAVVYPGGATGETELLNELQRRLPSFNNDAVTSAMSCTTDRYFLVWQRAA